MDEAAGVLLAEMAGDGAAHGERAVQMDRDHVGPVRPAHAVENLVAQDAGVVDEDVDAAEGVERGFHDLVGVRRIADRERGGDCLTAGLLDLVRHLLRRTGVAAGAVERSADVIDQDLRALLRQQECDGAADAATRAGDDGDFSVDDAWHWTLHVMPGLVPGIHVFLRLVVKARMAGTSV